MGHCFVLGDNAVNSLDSRYFCPLPSESVLGKVKFSWGYAGFFRLRHGYLPWEETKAIERLAPGQNRPSGWGSKSRVKFLLDRPHKRPPKPALKPPPMPPLLPQLPLKPPLLPQLKPSHKPALKPPRKLPLLSPAPLPPPKK